MLRTLVRPPLRRLHQGASLFKSDTPDIENESDTPRMITRKLPKSKYAEKQFYKYTKNPSLPKNEHPLDRAMRVLKADFKNTWSTVSGAAPPPPIALFQADILVVGGGIVGSSVAHFLKDKARYGVNVIVVEKEPVTSSTSLAVASNGLYQQIPSRPRAEMAQFCAEFYRKLPIDLHDPEYPLLNFEFTPNSSLQLASADGIEMLHDLSEMYKEMDWSHELLNEGMLEKRYPWMNVEDVAMGSLGLNKEGMVNPWKVVEGIRRTPIKYDTEFITGNVVGFQFELLGDVLAQSSAGTNYYSPVAAAIQSPSGEVEFYNFGILVIAAGARSSEIVSMLNVGNIEYPWPIEARKRYVYHFSCPNGPGLSMPMVMEPNNGVRVRRCGPKGNYMAWRNPAPHEEPAVDNFDADESFFYEKLLPSLVHRVPAFKDAKLVSSWAGFIDQNIWDGNFILGPHPAFHNVYVAGGCGNDELLYGPAIGRAVSEMIIDGEWATLDLSHYAFDRLLHDEKIKDLRIS